MQVNTMTCCMISVNMILVIMVILPRTHAYDSGTNWWNYWGFVAIKDDGSVVSNGGGTNNQDYFNTDTIRYEKNVVSVVSTALSYAALQTDGTVLSWGHPSFLGDYDTIKSTLLSTGSGIVSISTTSLGFLALKNDNTAVYWGHSSNDPPIDTELTNIDEIFTNRDAFAILKKDGMSHYIPSTLTITPYIVW